MSHTSEPISPGEQIVEGIPASAGIAIATAFVLLQEEKGEDEGRVLHEEEMEIEIERFHVALVEADKLLEQIEQMARQQVQDRAEIFEALRMMLGDPSLAEAIAGHIRAMRTTARHAISVEMERLAAIFAASGDVTIRGRAEDMKSLQSHLITCLLKAPVNHRFHEDAILILSSLSPSDTVLYARNHAKGFVLESGGINSHSAILARALGIPMVAGVKGIARKTATHSTTIVDGYSGRVIVDPSPATLRQYREKKADLEMQRAKLGEIRALPAVTADGVRITLAANLDMVDEMESVLENGAEDIGLMRTEFLVMGRDTEISMEEQSLYYTQLAERAYPLPVTLRAFDIGSEKLAGEIWGKQSSPLGLRGARLLLARREILHRQVEGVLRASSMKNVRLMMPMVTSVEEIRALRKIIGEIGERLIKEGTAFDLRMPVGAMIETPAAALTAGAIATECDFLSLGTNDLAQYTLAIDRCDDALAAYYDELHPAVLRLIRSCALAAERAGVPLTLCGEIASHPAATELLIGLGIRRLSVQPLELAALKLRVRSIDSRDAHTLARKALRASTPEEVRGLLTLPAST